MAEKFRASFTSPKNMDLKGSISMEGGTSFIMNCMATLVSTVATNLDVGEDRVLQDIWAVILEERKQNAG